MEILNILDSGILVEKYGYIEEISKVFYGIAGKTIEIKIKNIKFWNLKISVGKKLLYEFFP